MFARDQYELIDFGGGRKLERFGETVLDRPAPAALGQIGNPERWRTISARFDAPQLGQQGVWSGPLAVDPNATRWHIAHPPLRFEARLAPTGQIGIFPEQAVNWDWLAEQLEAPCPRPRVLNLFAYTGGSTLACAARGAVVTHVDASRSAVAWARVNAALSGAPPDSIRWLVEDVSRFVDRELRRGNRYDAVILDPPSFGRGPRGEPWKFAEHLPRLLAACRELTSHNPRFILVTGHTPGWKVEQLRGMVAMGAPRGEANRITVDDLTVPRLDGTRLWSGWVARWKG